MINLSEEIKTYNGTKVTIGLFNKINLHKNKGEYTEKLKMKNSSCLKIKLFKS